jgi:hypothetical protein
VTGKKQSRKRANPNKRPPRKRVVKRGPDVAASAPAPSPPPPISSTGVTSVDDWLPPPRPIEPAPVDDWLPPPRPIEPPAAVDQAATTESPPAAEPGVRPAAAWLIAADLASLAVIGGLTFLNLAGTGGVVRLILALLFVTCVPGWALARGAGLAGGLTGIAVAVLSSLTICAAASTVMLWLNAWHPLMLLAGLGAVSAVVILWTLPPSFVAARLRI